jgi:hypothetical protein
MYLLTMQPVQKQKDKGNMFIKYATVSKQVPLHLKN